MSFHFAFRQLYKNNFYFKLFIYIFKVLINTLSMKIHVSIFIYFFLFYDEQGELTIYHRTAFLCNLHNVE